MSSKKLKLKHYDAEVSAVRTAGDQIEILSYHFGDGDWNFYHVQQLANCFNATCSRSKVWKSVANSIASVLDEVTVKDQEDYELEAIASLRKKVASVVKAAQLRI
jgi:hypothetical protein